MPARSTLGAFAAALGALSLALASTAAAATIPVVRCPTVFGVAGASPRAPSALTVSSGAARLVAYTNTQSFLLGPRGMRCAGILAADGGSQIVVWSPGHPRPSAHARVAALTLSVDPACAGCKAGEACPFFTALARALGFPCVAAVPARESVARPRANLVLFRDPPGLRGSGWPSGGSDPANGLVGYTGRGLNASVYRATCTLPSRLRADCTAVLNDVIGRYG